MPSFLFTAAAFVVALGILIAVHEFGHYWVAKRLGVKVLRFSIGFGKPLRTWIGGPDRTEYVIAAIPLGGYVKMLDEREGEVAEAERRRAFNRQPLAVRSAVVAAGPLFNFAFAILAYWLVFVTGVTGMRPIVGEVLPGSDAQFAGLQPGDEILTVGGREVATWEAAVLALAEASLDRQVVGLEVRTADGARRLRPLDLSRGEGPAGDGKLLEQMGIEPFRPRLPAVIEATEPDSPAARAGLLPGDRLVTADGLEVDSWGSWVEYVRARPGVAIEMEVARGAERLAMTLRPEPVAAGGETIGRVGARVRVPEGWGEEWRAEYRYGPIEALGRALEKTAEMSLLTLRVLGKMVIGEASLKNVSGPLSIAQYAGHAAAMGFSFFVSMLALLSLSLGVLNLLPVPVLDGGHLMYYLIELVRGKPLSDEMQERGQRIGIALLVALMGLAFYNDLVRLLA